MDEETRKKRIVIFTDTVQAFYCAAVVGHMLQRGDRYIVNQKGKELILRQQWDRREKSDLRKALTFLCNTDYGVTVQEEVLQVIAELAEAGSRNPSC